MIPVPQFRMAFGFPVGGILGWVRGYAMKAPVEGALSLKLYRFDIKKVIRDICYEFHSKWIGVARRGYGM